MSVHRKTTRRPFILLSRTTKCLVQVLEKMTPLGRSPWELVGKPQPQPIPRQVPGAPGQPISGGAVTQGLPWGTCRRPYGPWSSVRGKGHCSSSSCMYIPVSALQLKSQLSLVIKSSSDVLSNISNCSKTDRVDNAQIQ